jgi:pimeloyl-ACP methyl ester carboxylesterase
MPDRSLRRLLAAPLLSLAVAGHLALAADVPAETLVEAPGPAGPLRGTMLGDGKGPVALIVPGSGPTDRDGNNPLGIRAATYKLLAQDLAARGITTVRIDKRGMFGSATAVPDANAVTIADYVADVDNWVAAVRERTGAQCVWLIGHSEGGLVAMAAAKEGHGGQHGVCGLVLLAVPGRPLGTVLRDQLRANPANAPLLGQATAAIDALEAGRRVDAAGLHPALRPLFGPQVQGFLISAFSYDPRELLAGCPQPVLIVQGQRDIQVGEADARLLKDAAPRATLVLVPDANHVFKRVASADPAANMAAYADPGLPLAPGVAGPIADFIGTRTDGKVPAK